jgi:hypothetical protein
MPYLQKCPTESLMFFGPRKLAPTLSSCRTLQRLLCLLLLLLLLLLLGGGEDWKQIATCSRTLGV